MAEEPVLVDVEVEVVNLGTFGMRNYKKRQFFFINEKLIQSGE